MPKTSDAASPPAEGGAPPVDSLSFEDALRRLEEIVRQLESGDVALERSIALSEYAETLRAHCEAKLKDAQLRVEKIVLRRDGPAAAAFETE